MFFNVIDWLGGTRLFRSQAMQTTCAGDTRRVHAGACAHARCRRCYDDVIDESKVIDVFSNFFINRPIFASVLSIIITLAGLVASGSLPVAQYPEIAPPTVEVSAIYPGANAEVVADTVAAPIEQQVNGVEGMMYMSSQCTNDGTYNLTVTFQHGVDLNIAQVLVQNRVDLAQPILPDLVKRNGVTVKKKSTSVLMIINLFSPDGSRNDLYLSNYATIQLKDELSRLKGVGDITYLGKRDYSMRVWLDPDKLTAYSLIGDGRGQRPSTQQNTQVAAGQVGQPPVPSGQVFQLTMSTMGRLRRPGAVRRHHPPERRARAGWCACATWPTCSSAPRATTRPAPWTASPRSPCRSTSCPAPTPSTSPATSATKMEELHSRFPAGLSYDIVYDTTPFITESIKEVVKTLFDAVILVAVVVLLFLQNWRTALIPLVAVPVAVMGTFAVMALLGFSLNNLTLFGLVLAIGIVVDDAIVVVEAVERQMEHGLPPQGGDRRRRCGWCPGRWWRSAWCCRAVFVPCAFITGITGQFYRQFALTIAVSTVISAFNSLTLSPALSALLLQAAAQGRRGAAAAAAPGLCPRWAPGPATPTSAPGWRLARLVELLPPALAAPPARDDGAGRPCGCGIAGGGRWPAGSSAGRSTGFSAGSSGASTSPSTSPPRLYARVVGVLLRGSVLVLAGYGGLLVLTWWGFTHTPTGFIPQQDKGYLLVNVQLPDSASLQRTDRVMRDLEERGPATCPASAHTVAIGGQSVLLNANAPNFGSMFVMLTPFEDRLKPGLSGDAIAARLQVGIAGRRPRGAGAGVRAPPVEGLGTAGGFKIVVEDRGDTGQDALQAAADRVVQARRGRPGSWKSSTPATAPAPPGCTSTSTAIAAKKNGVSIAEIFNTLQVDVGSLYVNDFNKFGRTWKVTAQASDEYRRQVKDLKHLRIRNDKRRHGAVRHRGRGRGQAGSGDGGALQHVPRRPIINGSPGPGVSSGQAIARMEQVDAGGAGPVDAPGVDRVGLPAIADGQHGHAGLRPGGGAGLPGAGGAVRELVAAAGRHPGGAHVPALLDGRRGAGAHGHQHLHAGRLHRAGGVGVQERHPDCRVCQAPSARPACRPTRRRWRRAGCGCGRS